MKGSRYLIHFNGGILLRPGYRFALERNHVKVLPFLIFSLVTTQGFGRLAGLFGVPTRFGISQPSPRCVFPTSRKQHTNRGSWNSTSSVPSQREVGRSRPSDEAEYFIGDTLEDSADKSGEVNQIPTRFPFPFEMLRVKWKRREHRIMT